MGSATRRGDGREDGELSWVEPRAWPKPAPEDMAILLRSEFASVEVAIDRAGNGPRLRVTDMVRGRTVYLDPLQLEALTRAPTGLYDAYLPY